MLIGTTVSNLYLNLLKIIVISFLSYIFFQVMGEKFDSSKILQKLSIFAITGGYQFIDIVKLVLYLFLKSHSFFFWCIVFVYKDSHPFNLVVDLSNLVIIVLNYIPKLSELFLKSVELLNRGQLSHKSLKLNNFFFLWIFLFTSCFKVIVHVERNFIIKHSFDIRDWS